VDGRRAGEAALANAARGHGYSGSAAGVRAGNDEEFDLWTAGDIGDSHHREDVVPVAGERDLGSEQVPVRPDVQHQARQCLAREQPHRGCTANASLGQADSDRHYARAMQERAHDRAWRDVQIDKGASLPD